MRVVVTAIVIILVLLGSYEVARESAPPDNLARDSTPGAAPASASQASVADPMMVGTWKSTRDPKFTREFRAGGTVMDRYEGDEAAAAFGTWMVIDPAKENTGVPADSLAGVTVLKLTFGNGEILYFGVRSVSENSLELVYLGRGNILSFIRVR